MIGPAAGLEPNTRSSPLERLKALDLKPGCNLQDKLLNIVDFT